MRNYSKISDEELVEKLGKTRDLVEKLGFLNNKERDRLEHEANFIEAELIRRGRDLGKV